ncbi:hypothetical protein CFK41_12545 [Brachybacterium ginsengisoli]|uniref:Uncharacterized protein n=1 Tax=Brachybacterium ginsengisoli TaxID=1331682 RepID=A0A291GZ62_9MICO|nr:hypothetical protein [Brachybacterium ginsengisoli]ATG55509.1 hypothetical protein CFK41_12545 [Brachybacterium ginsengisoli]
MSDYQPIPTTAPEESSPQGGRAKNGLVAAAALSAVLLLLGTPWETVLSFGGPFLLFSLAQPASGFYALTAALWLFFTVPGVLRRLARRRTRAGGTGLGRTPSKTRDAAGRRRLSIPRENLEDVEGEFRRDLAEALGIPWRDELFFDQGAWSSTCRAAAEERAASDLR